MATSLDLPQADLAEWGRLRAHAEAWVDDPAFFSREGNVLAVGQVPQRT